MKVIIKTNKYGLKQKILLSIFNVILLLAGMTIINVQNVYGQTCNNKIGDFTSLYMEYKTTGPELQNLKLPDTHTFQQIFLTDGSINDFNMGLSAYVPDGQSTTEGFLCINNGIKATPNGGNGEVKVLNLEFNEDTKLWAAGNSQNLDFSAVGGTSKNSSGAATPWGTFISSENHVTDGSQVVNYDQGINDEGYYKYGWQVEINPKSKQVLGKRYEMGRFKHENAAIHPNRRTIYQGDDASETPSYLYKFVADKEGDLTAGKLFVYKADENATTGKWLLLDNKGPGDINIAAGDCNLTGNNDKWGSNNVKHQAACLGATGFGQMEDVEIGPDGKVYFIDSSLEVDAIYYLEDLDPEGLITNTNQSTVNFMGVYAGGYLKTYKVKTISGIIIEQTWGSKPDNMEFDNAGNLYVCKDSGNRRIWMFEKGHSQINPKVKIIALTPKHFTPKGITFSPDNRFMFLSLASDDRFNDNTEEQLDASETPVVFNKTATVVIARKEHLGIYNPLQGCTDVTACNFNPLAAEENCTCKYPEPDLDCDRYCSVLGNDCEDNNIFTENDTYNQNCECVGELICNTDVVIRNNSGINDLKLRDLYISSNSIETKAITNNPSNTVTVGSNKTLNLESNHIKLNEGFKVESGGCLNAVIKPCE